MPLVEAPISPSEILEVILSAEIDPLIVPGGVVVGPASDAEQQAGVVSITDAGNTRIEQYAFLLWTRAQLRCLAPSLADVDRIAYHVHALLFDRRRQVVSVPSTGQRFLVHHINPSAGPSQHYDSAETWEGLLFAQVCIGGCPV